MNDDNSPKKTLVEAGTELTGTLKSTCPVVVNGTIDGEFTAPQLTITSTGAVLGTIKVDKLQSDGTLSGNIDADDVYLAGTVKSNTVIKAKALEVKLAADRGKLEVTFGECNLEIGDDPGTDVETQNNSYKPFPRPESDSTLWNRPASVPPSNGASDSMPPPGE